MKFIKHEKVRGKNLINFGALQVIIRTDIYITSDLQKGK
jgi:hypothetical protein